MKLNEVVLNEVSMSNLAQLMKLPQDAGYDKFTSLLQDLGYKQIGTEGAYGETYVQSNSTSHVIKILHTPDPCYMQFATKARKLMKNPHVPKFMWMREFTNKERGVFILERLVEMDDVRPELVAAKYKTDLDLAILQAVRWDVDWMEDGTEEWIEQVQDLAYENVTKHRSVDMKKVRSATVPQWNQALQLVNWHGCVDDLHDKNVMIRYKTMEFVIIDPAFSPYY